jgi:hypothetical protein
MLPGAGKLTFIDIDDTVREVHGYASKAPASATAASAD